VDELLFALSTKKKNVLSLLFWLTQVFCKSGIKKSPLSLSLLQLVFEKAINSIKKIAGIKIFDFIKEVFK